MRSGGTAAAWAEQQVASVRDDPAGRIALMHRCYYGPYGQAPRHLPFRRGAMSFMQWQLRRGLLQPLSSDHPGSPWWRAVNERTQRGERLFMNVVLCRVLYTHALVAAPRISLGWLRPIAPLLGDPRLGMAGIFLQLSRVLPDEYPLSGGVRFHLSNELAIGRLLDYGVIAPRLQQLYEWSAHELAAPGLLDCVRDGALTYAWSFEDRGVWQPPKSFIVKLAQRVLPPERRP